MSSMIPPAVDPEVALLLTNEETLCEKAITLLLKISSSIVQQPNEKRVRSLNLNSRAMELTLLPAHGAFELLFFMGFQEANDRLVMPDDACLETVKMYQEQLHQLLNWKTSNSSGGSGGAATDRSLPSPTSLHSPALLRSSSAKQSPQDKTKNNKAQEKKRLPSGGSISSSDNANGGKNPVRTPHSAVVTPAALNVKAMGQPAVALCTGPQQTDSLPPPVNGAPMKPSDTASRSSSSSHASASTGGSSGSASGSSSLASSVVTPLSSSTVTAAATGATSKRLSPYKLQPHQRWLSRFQGYLQRVLTYEDPVNQAKARSLIPMARLHSAANTQLKQALLARKEGAKGEAKVKEPHERLDKPLDLNDHLLGELTNWFKSDFFRWFDCGWCSACRCNMASKSTVPPTKHELKGEANTVEYYQCQRCGADRRFPRYLDVGRLLETREGRCGEWASCFTLCCRTLGFDARQVFDETDHTWTEVWSQSQSRWVHVDPCEGRIDCPLLYECGWGKALSYVIAVSRDEVMDVTWRYTLQPNEVKKRRDKVSEEELCQHLWGLTVQLQQQHQQHTRHQLHIRMAREIASFFSPTRTPTKAELEGRSSGSLGWRVSRGETGVLQTTSHHTFTLHHTARITTLSVKYNPVRDSYLCEGTVGPAMLQGWQSGVHTAANLAIKREHDWHNVYIARTEGETGARVGEVTWRVRWESCRVRLDALHVVLRHALFHGATVTWGVTVDGEHHAGDHSGELRIENLCSRAANKAAANLKSCLVTGSSAALDSNQDNNNPAADAGQQSQSAKSKINDKDTANKANKFTRRASPSETSSRNNGGVEASHRHSSTSPSSRGAKPRGKSNDPCKSSNISKGKSHVPVSPDVRKLSKNQSGNNKPVPSASVKAESSSSDNKNVSQRSASESRKGAGLAVDDRQRPSSGGKSSSIKQTASAVSGQDRKEAWGSGDRTTGGLDNTWRDGKVSGELVVRAVLGGGEGESAWQHAQLFRLPDTDVDSAPFLIELNFL
ncbi:peptide-N(4)-(N-acetyl-beta-glucosaminyl)asparagine amidase isoform X2 [Hyalella azteca]|uniref:Peptide-N(4)-(N-acetyl-beta-glucosaminyl)asparagine amidase n=1 Tax=Hyalella azteca TaxID=294128 RepID=A0A8B7NPJ7_HYAAZ|nr:peptide-N(4)-(N-acetyl-beta-glucosaminyl)asparagine amidase isoform X2 [Hyalella azteca]